MIWLLYSIQVDLTNTSCGTTEPFENRFWNPYQRICRYNELFFCAPSHKLLSCKLTRYSGNWIEPYLFADSLVGYRAKKSDQQNQLSAVWCLKKKKKKKQYGNQGDSKAGISLFLSLKERIKYRRKVRNIKDNNPMERTGYSFQPVKAGFLNASNPTYMIINFRQIAVVPQAPQCYGEN